MTQGSASVRATNHDLHELVTKGLSEAERSIIVKYYYEERTMKELGDLLDLSESRMSQMHSAILSKLKAQMQVRSIASKGEDVQDQVTLTATSYPPAPLELTDGKSLTLKPLRLPLVDAAK